MYALMYVSMHPSSRSVLLRLVPTFRYLHFVPSNNEWWVSDQAQFLQHKRHGYINVVGSPDMPPKSSVKPWELYIGNNTAKRFWEDTNKVQVDVIPGANSSEHEHVVMTCEFVRESIVWCGGGG